MQRSGRNELGVPKDQKACQFIWSVVNMLWGTGTQRVEAREVGRVLL